MSADSIALRTRAVMLMHCVALLRVLELSQVIHADREMVESQADEIIKHAKEQDVAFLVVGDPFA